MERARRGEHGELRKRDEGTFSRRGQRKGRREMCEYVS